MILSSAAISLIKGINRTQQEKKFSVVLLWLLLKAHTANGENLWQKNWESHTEIKEIWKWTAANILNTSDTTVSLTFSVLHS